MHSDKAAWHLFVPKLYTTLTSNYTIRDFRSDVISGLTVAVVALPLAMALAVASGTSPDKGLVTAIVAGFFISLLGGSRFQIGGPTGAFVVVVFNVIHQFGYNGLVTATFMAGGFLVIAGLLRLGTFIKYIPHPVITGFTSGIAVIIMVSQIKDFLGLKVGEIPAEFIGKIETLAEAIHTLDPTVVTLSVVSIGIIFGARKLLPKYPPFLITVFLITLATTILGLPVETIGSKFGSIPSSLPSPALPDLSLDLMVKLLPSALTIAFLAGIESLLSAIIADGMTGAKHRSNCELIAQGVANSASALFAGLPATGAIARTATNIRSGAKSPMSGIIHALCLLLFVLLLAPLASYIPLACLSAILMIVAWNMSELDKFIHLFKSPIGDRVVLVLTFVLTVTVDLNLAIEVGVVSSAILFMHRMANAVQIQSHTELIQQDEDDSEDQIPEAEALSLPKSVLTYHIYGPFFFGAAERLIETINHQGEQPKVIILQMKDVPFIDATGASALMSLIDKTSARGIILIFTEANSLTRKTLTDMKVIKDNRPSYFAPTFAEAKDKAEVLLAEGA